LSEPRLSLIPAEIAVRIEALLRREMVAAARSTELRLLHFITAVNQTAVNPLRRNDYRNVMIGKIFFTVPVRRRTPKKALVTAWVP
jgi:hypothetical protein